MGYRKYACGHEPTGRHVCPKCGSDDLVEKCTCGSGGHPYPCDLHPLAYDKHIAELEAENDRQADPTTSRDGARREGGE